MIGCERARPAGRVDSADYAASHLLSSLMWNGSTSPSIRIWACTAGEWHRPHTVVGNFLTLFSRVQRLRVHDELRPLVAQAL